MIIKKFSSTRKDKLCEMKFTDSYDSTHFRLVDCSSIILEVLKYLNVWISITRLVNMNWY